MWVGFFAVCAPALPQAQAVTLTFEDFGTQPNAFSAANPLREEYAGQGVHFSGPTALGGGAILNVGGNFGVNPLSGDHFLGFNPSATMLNSGIPTGPETVQFDFEVGSVSLFAGSGTASSFTLTAYNASNSVVATDSQSSAAGAYASLAVSGAGITRVTFEQTAGSFWVVDNLTFETVPEASTTGVLGLAGLGLLVRRRRTA